MSKLQKNGLKLMRKIVDIGAELSFYGRCFQGLSNENNWDLEVVASPVLNLKENSELILLPLKDSWSFVGDSTIHTSAVSSLRACDIIHKEQGRWIPRLLSSDILKRLVVEKAGNLDFRHAAYVIGTAEGGRVASAFCAQLGFRHIVIIVESIGASDESISLLRKLYLGVEFEELLASQLVLRGTLGSLIINSDILSSHETLLEDVSYFNFMAEGGFILDVEVESRAESGAEPSRLLYNEAIKAGLRSSSGLQLSYYYIQKALELLNIKWNLDEKNGVEKIRTFI
jgi:hypothetical protein